MTKTAGTNSNTQVTKAVSGSAGQLERINALLKWWGAPVLDFSTNESQLMCLQEFTDGIQSLYRDASKRQRHLLEKGSQDVNSSLTQLAWPRKPSELLRIQSTMAAKLLDGMSHQSRLWTDMAEGFVDCYATFAKANAELCHRRRGKKLP